MTASRYEADPQQGLLELLILALSRLARPAEDQIAYLDALGVEGLADELALEFDDVAEAALAAPGLLSEDEQSLIRNLVGQLGEMSGPERADFWSQRALRTSSAWTEIRRTARAALSQLHTEPAASR